jgi:hypothetical protein
LQTLLTDSTQASQTVGSFIIGNWPVYASFQNRQMYCIKAEHSLSDHSVRLGREFFDLSGKRDFLDVTFAVTRLDVGFPGVLPSSTTRLLDAILPCGYKILSSTKGKITMFNDLELYVAVGSVGERLYFYTEEVLKKPSRLILANGWLQKIRKLQTNLTQKLPRKQAYKNITKPFAHRG